MAWPLWQQLALQRLTLASGLASNTKRRLTRGQAPRDCGHSKQGCAKPLAADSWPPSAVSVPYPAYLYILIPASRSHTIHFTFLD